MPPRPESSCRQRDDTENNVKFCGNIEQSPEKQGGVLRRQRRNASAPRGSVKRTVDWKHSGGVLRRVAAPNRFAPPDSEHGSPAHSLRPHTSEPRALGALTSALTTQVTADVRPCRSGHAQVANRNLAYDCHTGQATVWPYVCHTGQGTVWPYD